MSDEIFVVNFLVTCHLSLITFFMFRFIARRMLETVVVLFVIFTLTFFMVHLAPGKPFDSERSTTPEIRRQLMAYYHFDKSLPEQYWIRLKQVVTGDFGMSHRYANRRVN